MTSTAPLAFITGASSGIGQALAGRFADAGYRLALVARRTAEIESWATARGLGAGSYRIYSADVGAIDSIVAAAKDCLATQGLPDVVIANAGISVGIDTAERGDLDVMAQTFAINNVGLAATFHPFVVGMVERGSGRLVGIGSVASIRGLPGHGAYCASKAARWNLTLGLARTLAPDVTVNGIAPGVVEWPADYPEAEREKYLKRVPLARPGTPEDVAAAVHYFCTDGKYVTGQVLRLDGGRSIT